MKYQGKITDPKDLVTKEYVDTGLSGKLGTSGDGSNVTAAFTAASSRTNISTGEKLSVIFGKIAKWFADLGAAAFRGVDAAPTANSTNLVESGGVKSALDNVESKIYLHPTQNRTNVADGQTINYTILKDGWYCIDLNAGSSGSIIVYLNGYTMFSCFANRFQFVVPLKQGTVVTSTGSGSGNCVLFDNN